MSSLSKQIVAGLVDNSKSAMYSAIEIHNKPIFPYRYEVCAILVINSWELILKAFISINYPEIKILDKNGLSKPFDDCNDFALSKIGTDFKTAHTNLNLLYEYRCRIMHFYEDRIDVLLFSLLSKNVILYYEFLLKHFGTDVSKETNLYLMPIGFKRPISPIDFITNTSVLEKSSESVQVFVKSVVDSAYALDHEGIDDSVLVTFKMSVINENRVKNADIIAAITKNRTEASINVEAVLGAINLTNEDGAKTIKIDEDSLYDTVYTETYADVVRNSKSIFSNFSLNAKFHQFFKRLKGNPNFHKVRFLDVKKRAGGGKDYYTKKVYEELATHYDAKD
jgi:hypothetical protein